MKIVSKTNVGKLPVYDLSVKDKEQYIFSNGIVSHNTGVMYSANTVLFVTKAQEKDGTDLAGFKFTLVAEKSRTVKEKSKFPLTVTFDRGINKYSGMLDLAIELGFINKPKMGWYSRVIKGVQEEKLWRAKDTNIPEFWDAILNDPAFDEACAKRFKLSAAALGEEPDNVEDAFEDDVDYDLD
jgi:hypothetical protein